MKPPLVSATKWDASNDKIKWNNRGQHAGHLIVGITNMCYVNLQTAVL